MNYKGILFFLGIYSLLVSFFSIINIFYSIYFEFIIGLNSYLITFFISLIVGYLFYYVGQAHSKDITLTDQIIFVVLSFILICFEPIVPIVASKNNKPPNHCELDLHSIRGSSIFLTFSIIEKPVVVNPDIDSK